MSWLLAALAAQIILGTSDTFDRALLKRRFFDPWVYTFWVGVLGLFALVFAPWGFEPVPVATILIAFAAGALLIAAVFFLFSALARAEASSALPLIGSLTPLFTLALAWAALGNPLGKAELVGFSFLVLGGFSLYAVEEKELRLRLLALSLASAFLFGISSVLAKMVFNQSPFFTGLIWIRLGEAIFVFLFLYSPALRGHIIAASRGSGGRNNRLLYLANRGYAGLGALLLSFAISLSHPALVDATQSLRYAVIFVAGGILLREKFRGRALFGKVAAAVLVAIGIAWLGLASYAKSLPVLNVDRPIVWGVTYSAKFSRYLGLDPERTFEAILYEVEPRKMRLAAYWDDIEKERGVFDFSDLDFQLERTKDADIPVALALGMKVPRWPECHIPEWAKQLKTEERESALREYMQRVVERYSDHPALERWQMENEPFLRFGVCPERGENFVDKEIELVKRLDPRHPVIVTDGGELGLWARAASRGDIFGTTMYRRVYPVFIEPLFGVIEYPLAPSFFRVKEQAIRRLTGEPDKKFVVIELQGEPWGRLGLSVLPLEEQLEIFSPEYFSETIQYAKETGFGEYYLWGAEWWYWMKEKHGDTRFWVIAQELFRK